LHFETSEISEVRKSGGKVKIAFECEPNKLIERVAKSYTEEDDKIRLIDKIFDEIGKERIDDEELIKVLINYDFPAFFLKKRCDEKKIIELTKFGRISLPYEELRNFFEIFDFTEEEKRKIIEKIIDKACAEYDCFNELTKILEKFSEYFTLTKLIRDLCFSKLESFWKGYLGVGRGFYFNSFENLIKFFQSLKEHKKISKSDTEIIRSFFEKQKDEVMKVTRRRINKSHHHEILRNVAEFCDEETKNFITAQLLMYKA